MKKLNVCLTGTVMTLAALAACVESDTDVEEQPRLTETEQIVHNLELAGYPSSDIGVTADGVVFVGSDAAVSLQASREMAGIIDDSVDEGFRQYRTNNVVDTARVQTICINTTASFDDNADPATSNALDTAIANYANMGLQFTMVRNGNGCDATIDAKLDNSGGGIAGFPSNGDPYTEFTIGKDIAGNYGVNVAAHVMTHELGHCVGFRHTDYYNRSISCGGQNSNEGEAGVGAVHIPGTPTDAVMNGSVMNSCYNANSDAQWTEGDLTSLDCLYASGSCAPPPPPDYVNRSTILDLSGANGSETQLGPFNASGFDAVRFQMTGGSGDADIYVRYGAWPTTNTWDCRPWAAGNEETCEFNPSDDGLYYVMIDGYQAYAGLTLTFDAAGEGGGNPDPEVCDDGIDNDNDGSTDCDDTDCDADPACEGGSSGGPSCGDDVCDVGESCDGRSGTTSCSADCDGQVKGKPSGRFCYVDGVCEGPGCP